METMWVIVIGIVLVSAAIGYLAWQAKIADDVKKAELAAAAYADKIAAEIKTVIAIKKRTVKKGR